MTVVTSFLPLTAWNNPIDNFNYQELANNWTAIAAHDHTTGKGKQIPTGGIADLAITTGKLATSVQSALTDSRAPNGTAGGVLAGTYPNPSFAAAETTRVVGAAGQPAFNTGWFSFTEVRFWKDEFGWVNLAGQANRSSGTNDVIFSLPAGYLPRRAATFTSMVLEVTAGSPVVAKAIELQANDGQVRLKFSTSNNVNVPLDGIRFHPSR